jgi:hypothetical protein
MPLLDDFKGSVHGDLIAQSLVRAHGIGDL